MGMTLTRAPPGKIDRVGVATQGISERAVLMAFPVENLRLEQPAIQVCQQPEADITLAVPELPRHEPQHVLAGRKVQESVKILLQIKVIENVGISFLALGRHFVLERERDVTMFQSNRTIASRVFPLTTPFIAFLDRTRFVPKQEKPGAVAFRGAWRPATGTPTAGGQPRPSVSLCGGKHSLSS
jgi:hypothetical protein